MKATPNKVATVTTAGINIPRSVFFALWTLVAFPSFAGSVSLIQLPDRYGPTGKKVFAILSKPEVVEELKISPSQVSQIKEIRNIDAKAIPAVSNLLYKSERTTNFVQRMKRTEEVIKLTDSFQLEKYYSILSSGQSNRLQEILLNVCGLKNVIVDQRTADGLRLTELQLKSLKDVIGQYDLKLDPLYKRFQRQQIAGLSPGESLESRSTEVKELVHAICEAEKAREVALVAVLNNDQRKAWDDLKGMPLKINWILEDFMGVP